MNHRQTTTTIAGIAGVRKGKPTGVHTVRSIGGSEMTDSDRSDLDHYGPGTPCSQCGQELSREAPEWAEYCSVHSAKRNDPESGAVPIGVLEDLVADMAKFRESDEPNGMNPRQAVLLYENRLREVINDYE